MLAAEHDPKRGEPITAGEKQFGEMARSARHGNQALGGDY
jgi:hypothetical protein